MEAQYAWVQSQLDATPATTMHASMVGSRTASQHIERSLRDGAGRTWPVRNRPVEFAGMWQATYHCMGSTQSKRGPGSGCPGWSRHRPLRAATCGTAGFKSSTR